MAYLYCVPNDTSKGGEEKMTLKKNKNWVDFKEIKSKVGIEDILSHYGLLENFKQKGDEWIGFCPIHDENNYSPNAFRANTIKNNWHCFACGQGGNIIDFVAAMEKVEPKGAAKRIGEWFLATHQSPQQPHREEKDTKKTPDTQPKESEGNKRKEKVKTINAPLTFTLKNLDTEHQYLEERGLNTKTIEHFGLGLCTKGLMAGRIVIPIHNEKGQLIAYAGRYPGDPPEGESKYKLPPGFKKNLILFNLHRAKQDADKENPLILVEGFFDCMKVWQAEFKNVVALTGVTMSEEQKKLLLSTIGRNGRIVLMFDGDEAGREGSSNVLSQLSHQAFVKEIKLEPGQQPDRLEEAEIKRLLT
jgi:DNA primase